MTESGKSATPEKTGPGQPADDPARDARRKKIAEILAAFDELPVVDDRSDDEILGYNEFGLFD